ncbi:MAG TPA: hypothetical protein PKY73_13945, partial [Hyphomonas sp.]|nr:hypothetical protein [Hyphomonas sp.]
MTQRHPKPAPISLGWAQDFLRQEASRIDADPQTNSVFSLAQTLFRKLEAGETSLSALAGLSQEVHLSLIEARARSFRERHAGAAPAAAWA